jgi:hypothetical protein
MKRVLAALLGLSLSLQAANAAEPRPSNKWRIEVSEGANSDGSFIFEFLPKGGAPTLVTVPIKDGRYENGVARDIAKVFKKSLDRKTYKIEVDDNEDVLVKKRKGPDFTVRLVESTVKSVRLNFDRE